MAGSCRPAAPRPPLPPCPCARPPLPPRAARRSRDSDPPSAAQKLGAGFRRSQTWPRGLQDVLLLRRELGIWDARREHQAQMLPHERRRARRILAARARVLRQHVRRVTRRVVDQRASAAVRALTNRRNTDPPRVRCEHLGRITPSAATASCASTLAGANARAAPPRRAARRPSVRFTRTRFSVHAHASKTRARRVAPRQPAAAAGSPVARSPA